MPVSLVDLSRTGDQGLCDARLISTAGGHLVAATVVQPSAEQSIGTRLARAVRRLRLSRVRAWASVEVPSQIVRALVRRVAMHGAARDILTGWKRAPAESWVAESMGVSNDRLQVDQLRCVKRDPHSAVLRVRFDDPADSEPMALKISRPPSLLKRVLAYVRPNRAYWSWQRAFQLRSLQIPTPRPLVAILPQRWCAHHSTLTAFEWLSDALQVDHFVQRLRQPGVTDGPAQQLQIERLAAESLGELIARLHTHRFRHRDLKVANLMLKFEHTGLQAYLVDLDGVCRVPMLTSYRRMKDLARLSVCFPDDVQVRCSVAARFAQAYVREFHGADCDWKPTARRLLAATNRLRRLKRRRLKRRTAEGQPQADPPPAESDTAPSQISVPFRPRITKQEEAA